MSDTDFVFALKGPRFATNRRVLAEARPAAYRLLDREVIGLHAEELATLAALLATVRNRLDDPGATPAADRASGG